MKTIFEPLTTKNWPAFEALFGEKGACGGCWCMYWRLKKPEFDRQKGDANRYDMLQLAKGKKPPGIMAMSEGKAVGWCAVAPRQEYVRLEKSRILKPVDELPVWSIGCFFITKAFRNRGLSVPLLKAAVTFAFSKGATVVEGYPLEPAMNRMPDVFAWTGISGTFKKAGFKEVARRSETRPIMRIFFSK